MSEPLAQPDEDGLITPKVGAWSRHKHWFLRRYIDIFTTGMKDKPWGGGLHYIDLFAGAGIEKVEGHGLDWGSPLIAAQARYPFTQIHACELDGDLFKALCIRLAKLPQPKPPQLINGDANEAVHDICKDIPSGALSLAFLDPFGLHLHFQTLKKLSEKCHNIDFIIFFPDHLDALRNWKIYLENPDSNLDRVLGGAWRQVTESPLSRRAEALTSLYVDRIRTLGYKHFYYERIATTEGQPLYKLIFCCKHPLGGKYWREIASKAPDGQGRLPF